MSEDIAIDENFQTSWDSSGDIETVRGDNELAQSFIISIVENVDLTTTLVASAIEEQRGAIEQAVRNNPRSDDPIDVFAEINREQSPPIVEYEVLTASTNFTILSE